MPPRKRLAARPKCHPCGGLAIFTDKLSADLQAIYGNMRAYPCPRCPGRWHVTSAPSQEDQK